MSLGCRDGPRASEAPAREAARARAVSWAAPAGGGREEEGKALGRAEGEWGGRSRAGAGAGGEAAAEAAEAAAAAARGLQGALLIERRRAAELEAQNRALRERVRQGERARARGAAGGGGAAGSEEALAELYVLQVEARVLRRARADADAAAGSLLGLRDALRAAAQRAPADAAAAPNPGASPAPGGRAAAAGRRGGARGGGGGAGPQEEWELSRLAAAVAEEGAGAIRALQARAANAESAARAVQRALARAPPHQPLPALAAAAGRIGAGRGAGS